MECHYTGATAAFFDLHLRFAHLQVPCTVAEGIPAVTRLKLVSLDVAEDIVDP